MKNIRLRHHHDVQENQRMKVQSLIVILVLRMVLIIRKHIVKHQLIVIHQVIHHQNLNPNRNQHKRMNKILSIKRN
jgi:hypothetical protein